MLCCPACCLRAVFGLAKTSQGWEYHQPSYSGACGVRRQVSAVHVCCWNPAELPRSEEGLAAAAAVMFAFALLAGIWPARSAARIDPMVALRDN